MKKLTVVVVFVGGLAAWVACACAQGYPADNSGKNVRDRQDTAVTSGDKSNTQSDLNISQGGHGRHEALHERRAG